MDQLTEDQVQLQMVPNAEPAQPEPVEPQKPEPQEQLIDGRFKSQAEKDAFIAGAKEYESQVRVAREQYMARQQQAQKSETPPDYWRELRDQYVRGLQMEAMEAEKANDPLRPVGYSFEQTVRTAVAIAEKAAEAKIQQMQTAFMERLNKEDSEKFFRDNPDFAPVRSEFRDLIEKHGVPIDTVMKVVDAVKPKHQPKPVDEDMIEIPTNATKVPRSLQALEDEIVDAYKKGDTAKYNTLMERRWVRTHK